MPILRKPLAVASFVIVPSLNATAWAAASPNEAAASAISSDQMSILIGMGAILCLLVIISAALIVNLQAQARALASAHPELRERYYSLPFGVPEGTVRGLVSVLIIIMGIAILVVQGPLGIESTEAIAGFISAVIAFYFVTREQAATTGALRDSNAAMRAAASDVARANETLSRVVLRADISSPDKSSRSAAERALANRIILEEVQAQRPDVDAETAIFDMGIGTVDAVVSKAATRYRAVVRDGSKFGNLEKRVLDAAKSESCILNGVDINSLRDFLLCLIDGEVTAAGYDFSSGAALASYKIKTQEELQDFISIIIGGLLDALHGTDPAKAEKVKSLASRPQQLAAELESKTAMGLARLLARKVMELLGGTS